MHDISIIKEGKQSASWVMLHPKWCLRAMNTSPWSPLLEAPLMLACSSVSTLPLSAHEACVILPRTLEFSHIPLVTGHSHVPSYSNTIIPICAPSSPLPGLGSSCLPISGLPPSPTHLCLHSFSSLSSQWKACLFQEALSDPPRGHAYLPPRVCSSTLFLP